jgi:hypothetical protein
LLLRGRNFKPLLSGLIKFAILWVRHDRRIAGRGRRPDVFDYRAGMKRQQLSGQGQASSTDRGDAMSGCIEWKTDTGHAPASLRRLSNRRG